MKDSNPTSPTTYRHPDALTNEEVSSEIRRLRDEIERLRAREERLLSVIRHYNPDDALFDHEKVVTNGR